MDNGQQKQSVLKSAQELKGDTSNKGKKGMPKWLILVLLVALIAGIAALVYLTDLFKAPEEELVEGLTTTMAALIARNPIEFDRITITPREGAAYTVVSQLQYDENGLTLDLADGQQEYVIDGMPYFTTNTANCRNMENYASSLSSVDLVEQGAQDLSIYGLAEPRISVNVQFRDGTASAFHLGDKVPAGTNYYLVMDGQTDVYLVSGGVNTAMSRSLNEMHQVRMPEPAVSGEMLSDLLIEQPSLETIEIKRITEEISVSISALKLVQPIQHDAHADRAPELIESLASLNVTAYEGHAEAPEQLAQYGLDVPRARITYTDTEGATLVIQVGSAKDAVSSYIAIDDTGDVYLTDTSMLSFLQSATAEYLVDQFVGLVNIKVLDRLTISANNAEPYVISIEREPIANEDGTQDTQDTYLFDGNVTEEKTFKNLYTEIISLTLDRMMPEEGAVPGEVQVTVRYQLNNGQPDILIEYLRYDNDYYAIQLNGQTLFLIKQNKLNSLLKMCEEAFANLE